MATWKIVGFGALVMGLVACGPSGGGGHDSGMGTGHDSGGGPADGGGGPMDGGGGPTDGGGGPVDYGMCGMAVDQCICSCAATDQMCPTNCINDHDDMMQDCGVCILRAQAGMSCCPTEGQAFIQCAQMALGDGGTCSGPDAGGSCVDMQCMAEETAFDNCLQRQLDPDGGSAACASAIDACFGNALDQPSCGM